MITKISEIEEKFDKIVLIDEDDKSSLCSVSFIKEFYRKSVKELMDGLKMRTIKQAGVLGSIYNKTVEYQNQRIEEAKK